MVRDLSTSSSVKARMCDSSGWSTSAANCDSNWCCCICSKRRTRFCLRLRSCIHFTHTRARSRRALAITRGMMLRNKNTVAMVKYCRLILTQSKAAVHPTNINWSTSNLQESCCCKKPQDAQRVFFLRPITLWLLIASGSKRSRPL